MCGPFVICVDERDVNLNADEIKIRVPSLMRRVLNRAKKGTNWVKSVHFWHFRQLPNSTMTFIGRATASMLYEKSHSFSDV